MQIYNIVDHTADIGMEIYGRTKKELFANAAWALKDILLENRKREGDRGREKELIVEGSDVADLLVNFIRELLYLVNGKRLIIQNCGILNCGNRRLIAKLRVEPYNKKKHSIKMELKAVTYHGLSVERRKSRWKARVIFDV